MDENPFADPKDVNPFMDPSVTQLQATQSTVSAGLDDDPFAAPVNEPATMPVAPVISQPGPPMEQPTSGYNNAGAGYGAGGGGGYGTGSSFNSQPPRQYGNEENQQKQEDIKTEVLQPNAEKLVEDEFRKREEDLERRERQLRDEQKRLEEARVYGDRVPNFPPIPKFFPCTPCVYHNIDFDIPPEHQLTVRRAFYHWQFTVACYLMNFIVCFGMICKLGAKNGVGSMFGLAIVFTGLFIPLSFLTWYRMLYNAVRQDSSMRYMLFFFTYGFQIAVSGIACLGINGGGFILDSSMRYMLFFFMYGFQIAVSGIATLGVNGGGLVGIISSTSTLGDSKALGIMGILCALMWAADTLVAVYLIMQIHKTYRTTGQSMEKASGEFAASAGSNRNFGQAVLRSL